VIHFTAQGPGEGAFSRELRVTMYKDKDSTGAGFYVDTVNVTGLGGGILYEWDVSAKLEVDKELTWLLIIVEGFGLNVMDVQRIALRYRDGVSNITDAAKAHRP
jgi:hypothetical protein